jgi:MerR family transcriptional regulator, copper efflux regulator
MRIGELATASGLTPSRIRFYEARGILAPAARRKNGYRDYPESAIAVLLFIDQGQTLGFTLAELSGALPTDNNHMPAPADLLAGLERKQTEIEQHIEIARTRHAQIGKLIAEMRSCEALGKQAVT